MINVAILGSTGSIGQSALAVVAAVIGAPNSICITPGPNQVLFVGVAEQSGAPGVEGLLALAEVVLEREALGPVPFHRVRRRPRGRGCRGRGTCSCRSR